MSEGSINVGEVSVSVVPDARGFITKLDGEVSPEAEQLGRSIGESLGRQIVRQVAPAVREALAAAAGPAREQGAKTGEDFAGSFATLAKARIEAAFQSLPKAKVGTDASHLDAELIAIRARLQELSEVRVGVDLDAGLAVAEIEAVKERLVSLAARSPHIDVKVDAARAIAELAAVRAAVDAVATPTAGGGGGLSGLLGSAAEGVTELVSGISASTAAAGALALALIPVAAVVAGAAASAALFATILGGVVIAAAIGLAPIIKTLTALNAADKKSAGTAASSAAARVNSAAAVKSATESLANTVANADSAAVRSAQAVKDARVGVVDAQRSAAQAVTRALGTQAAAEGALASAQVAARRAMADLTQARKDAQQQIEDLARATKQGALDERGGVLAIEEARKRLQDVNSNPLSTALDRREARLGYDEAVQQLDDIRNRNKQLAATKAHADAVGVSGAQGVLDAQQNLADATARVATAQQAVADAGVALNEARRAGAEAVARAEQQVTTALRAQRDQARQSAFSIAQAQEAINAARRQQATAVAGVSSAAETAKADLDKLSPAGRAFVLFLKNEFIPALGPVTRAATDGLASGLTRGLKAIEPILPVVALGIGRLASAAGDFFGRAAKGLASPYWANFFNFLTDLAGPAGAAASSILGNLATGFAGLLEAFAPFSKQVAGGLEGLSEKFAKFGNSAGKGGSLDRFLTFLHDKGPGVAHDLAEIAKAFADIVVAAAPLGLRILDGLGKFAAFIDLIKPALAPVLKSVNDLYNPISKLTDAFTALKDVFAPLKAAFTDTINYIIDGWNKIHFHVPGVDEFGVKFGGFDIGVNHIDHIGARALGGAVAAQTPYLVGERGPELFFPGSSGYVASHADSMAALLAASSRDLARNSLGGQGIKGSTVIEHFEQHNHHPATAHTDPREAMMRLEWELS